MADKKRMALKRNGTSFYMAVVSCLHAAQAKADNANSFWVK
jgi:hypothetical protein